MSLFEQIVWFMLLSEVGVVLLCILALGLYFFLAWKFLTR